MNGYGKYTSEVGERFSLTSPLLIPQLRCRLEGKPVLTEGNKEVLAILNEHSALLFSHKYKHRYPYDWRYPRNSQLLLYNLMAYRTKKPVIVRATSQWFCDVSPIKKQTVDAIGTMLLIPLPIEGKQYRD